mgnify:CR=1 FL=1
MLQKVKWQNWLKTLMALVKEHSILITIIFFSLILRMLWIKIPIHGDEGEAGYNAMMWARGLTPYIFRIMDKPPLMYLLYLIPIRLFGNNIIPIRILNNTLFLFSIIPLYLIAADWSGKRVGLFSALFYGIFMSVPAIEGPYALASSLSIPFLIFSVYFANKYSKFKEWWLLLISGLFASMVSLIYQQWAAIFILLVIIVLTSSPIFRKQNYGNKRFLFRNSVTSLSILIVGIIIPISLFAVYFWVHGALYDLIYNTIIKFLGYNLEFAKAQFVPFDCTFLTLVEGLPLWLLFMYGILICIRRRNKTYLYLLGWSFISLALLLVEPRHFGHYILFVVPPASILSGIALSSLITDIHSTSLRQRSRKAATILVIFIVLLSFVPSIFFQAKQFPNFSIDWKYSLGNTISVRICWRAEMEGNYDVQMSIANYLRSLKLNDGEVLLHGWFPHLYWLSGLEAPSAYICTFRDWAPIPDSEYQRLVNMVKEHNFKVIVLSNNTPKDAITNLTLGEYFSIKSIGDIQIFSRDTPEGYVSYRFIENFPQALKEYDQADGTRNYLETTKSRKLW